MTKPTRHSLNAAIAGSAALFLGTPALHAQNLFWDADPETAQNQNGSGVWNTTSANWTASAGNPANIPWTNGAGNTAFLGNVSGTGYSNPSAGGIITLEESITLFALSMSSGQAGSYIIDGLPDTPLELSGATAYLANNHQTATLTLNATVSGSDGLQKRNNGRVILNGENTYTGLTDILAGTLQFTRPWTLYGGDAEEWTGENIVVHPGAVLAFNTGGWDEFTAEDIDAILLSLDAESGGFLSGSSIGFDTSGVGWWEFEYANNLTDLADGTSSLGVSKLGEGALVLSGENTYTGPTVIAGGSLRAGADAAGLSPDSNLTFRNGVLEASGTFSRPLGEGPGQVRWLAQSAGGLGGGFAAVDGDLEVTFNDGAALNWSINGPFGSSALIFGSLNATHKITLTNGFSLNAQRTIRVDGGLGEDAAELSGVLTNASGGITKTGNGRLILSNANTYGAATTISAGTLEIRHDSALGTPGTGTTIQTGGGGRLALGGGISVAENLNIQARNFGEQILNADGDNTLTGTLTWNTGGLAYGVHSEEGKLTITGAVIPLGASKTLNVGGEGDVEFSGEVGDTVTGILTVNKHGGGTVTFSGGNTYTGNTTIGGGTLVLGSSDTLADTSTVFIDEGAELHLPNPGTSVVAALFVGGESLPEGIYGEDNTDGAITGEGKIQVASATNPATPFDDWMAGYPEIPEHLRGPDDDPDFDGTPNILEFALNGNPDDSSDNGLIASLIEDSKLKLVAAVRAGALFDENASATVDGIVYTVEGSLDLQFPGAAVSCEGPFATAPAATGLPDQTGTDWEYHIFTLDASEGLTGKGFLRLKVAVEQP